MVLLRTSNTYSLQSTQLYLIFDDDAQSKIFLSVKHFVKYGGYRSSDRCMRSIIAINVPLMNKVERRSMNTKRRLNQDYLSIFFASIFP